RHDGRVDLLPLPPDCPSAGAADVNRLAEDRDSTWAAIRACGLFRYSGGKWSNAERLGIPRADRYFAAAPDGAMWFGYRNGDVLRYRDGQLLTYALADGGVLGAIRFIDTQQDIVVSGGEGSAVLKNGKLQRLHASEPEALNNLAGLVILPNGDRWLNTGLGLAHVTQADWQASMRDPRRPLRLRLLDAADGYPGTPVLFATVPNGTLDQAGKIWFAGTDGIGVLDTMHMYRNPLPPTLQITSLGTGERLYVPADGVLQLPQRPERIDIQFAALSLTMPEKMQVLYQLEGVDRDWQRAGLRRLVSYANLSPGQYRFRLKAANPDGVWNETGVSLTFAIAPAFTQTVWFYLLCGIAVLGAGYGLYLMRMRQLVRRMNAVLGARLLERERIARALHDSLLQSVQALVLRFGAIGRHLPPDSPAQQKLHALLSDADGVIVEGRNAVMGLRLASVYGGDIALAFTRLVERMQAEHKITIVLNVRGARRRLDPLAWEEVYHVGAEALLNACRHASASRIVMELGYGVQEFSLTVRDNGKGIADEALHDGSRAGHWGVVGMRERAAALNGCLQLKAAPVRGLEVWMRIPAARAYDRDSRPSWRRRLRAWLDRLNSRA
ncbi:sensor histidine kinase, partial [Duganella callida]